MALALYHLRGALVIAEKPCRFAVEEPCASPSDRSSSTLGKKKRLIEQPRSLAVDWAFSELDGLALRRGHPSARDGHFQASQGISYLLDLESSDRQAQAPGPLGRDSRSDPLHKSWPGSTARSR